MFSPWFVFDHKGLGIMVSAGKTSTIYGKGLYESQRNPMYVVQGYQKVFIQLKCAICGWLVYLKKNVLNIKFLLVSYPHFLKISFNLTKCGLSYGFKRDLRPFSEFTQVWTILSLTASKNGYWRLPLIDWRSKVDWKVKLFPIEFFHIFFLLRVKNC